MSNESRLNKFLDIGSEMLEYFQDKNDEIQIFMNGFACESRHLVLKTKQIFLPNTEVIFRNL